MSRAAAWMLLLAAAGAVALSASCGFGLADDTGRPVPSGYWKWACPDGGTPAPDAGCRAPVAADGGDASPPDGR